jgi:hypothetical protein
VNKLIQNVLNHTIKYLFHLHIVIIWLMISVYLYPKVISDHLTSPHLTSPHLTSPHLTSPHLTSPHLTSPHLTSPHLTSPNLSNLTFVFLNADGFSSPHEIPAERRRLLRQQLYFGNGSNSSGHLAEVGHGILPHRLLSGLLH